MKANIESTSVLIKITDEDGNEALARRWDGVTESGIKFYAWIILCQVIDKVDSPEFDSDLLKAKPKKFPRIPRR